MKRTQHRLIGMLVVTGCVAVSGGAPRAALAPKPPASAKPAAAKPGTAKPGAAKPGATPAKAAPTRPAVPPELKPGAEKKNPKDGATLVYVPAGEFTMGADDGFENEKPAHKVRLTRGFWIYKTEVTNAMYGKFLAANLKYPRPLYWKKVALLSAPDQPVVGVTWNDAVAYCKWAGVRLPTEAEWEYAARGGDGRKYPWGKEEPDATRAIFGLPEAGGKPGTPGKLDAGASPFGARDMAGNVWEWCGDWYDRFAYRPAAPAVQPAAAQPAANMPPPVVSDPKAPASGLERVVRGGSWFTPAQYLRASLRMRYEPGTRTPDLGFRGALTE